MAMLIDRRLNSRNKNAVNRQRFLDRYRKHIKKAVDAAVAKRSIKDMERGERVSIPSDDVSEPEFELGQGGERSIVHPGNREFISGDRLPRPQGGQGGAGGKASNQGEGDDEFSFELTRDELLDVVFDGLALPNLAKRHLRGSEVTTPVHAGFSSDGVPARLSVVRTLRAAKSRRIALTGTTRRRILALEAEIETARHRQSSTSQLEEELNRLKRRLHLVPFLDDLDLRYHLRLRHPVPVSKAVMFCVMDVSGSMDQETKDMAKRFFLLLYLFLQRHYRRTEVVFIRHHTEAKEVDEQEFFYSRETGGTVVSSALNLMHEVITKRFPVNEWNIYGAQASDGDNWHDDSPRCVDILREQILPKSQYFAYLEIAKRDPQNLWLEYEKLAEPCADRFALRRITEASDIFPVFRGLFEKRQEIAA